MRIILALLAAVLLLAPLPAQAASSQQLVPQLLRELLLSAQAKASQPPVQQAAPQQPPARQVKTVKPPARQSPQQPPPAQAKAQQPLLPPLLQQLPPVQADNFYPVTNNDGAYSISLPKAFGSDPLAKLPNLHGPMLLRKATENLLLAVNIADPADTQYYRPNQRLPDFPGQQILCSWQEAGQLPWQCKVSSVSDYYGTKKLLQAQASVHGKTYELLYVVPATDNGTYLAQALYSLHSFTLKK